MTWSARARLADRLDSVTAQRTVNGPGDTDREVTKGFGMEPRIVVPDGDDMATVVAALVQYTHSVSARAMLNGDFSHMIDELSISVGLLEALRDQARADHASEVFGPLPSDEEMAESIEKFREEFGKDS